ncbi:aspartic peptidase domain-containing protein [Aspergillus bertholletiae]|uniref:Aspartic peptidase domain-containing protein n=1 Tax=Aspergillus bertholletiae TaxID=1226010 RepID=A0A5N7BJR1_9EURO|nr:aspartic peptidase domain-containing protein [Aspergillus bertholletiae]
MKLPQRFSILRLLTLSSALTIPLNRHKRSNDGLAHTASLLATGSGHYFDVDVIVGANHQTFKLLVDTGSSDAYIMGDGFACINATNNLTIPQADCGYGPETYSPSSSYQQVPNEMFGIEYGAGRASGVMAYEDITIAGVSVRAKLAIADVSEPMGRERISNGVLGLGYPSLTSAHPGSSAPNDTYFYNRAVYSPVFNTMFQKGLVEPYFAIALAHTARDSTTTFGGYLTLGDLPPVELKSDFSAVPVEIMKNIPPEFTSGKQQRAYWAFTVSGVRYGPTGEAEDALETDNNPWQVFIDTGNDFSILPEAVVDPVNKQFSPPGVWNDEMKVYVVNCDAKAPEFGVTIGNQTFYHAAEDLIFDVGDGVCVSSLLPAEKVGMKYVVVYVLGAPFYKNVVAVHDFGKNELRFAQK